MFKKKEPKLVKMFDVTVRMATSYKDPLPQQCTYPMCIKVMRHTHELELVQYDGRRTFINSSDYTTYWYDDGDKK